MRSPKKKTGPESTPKTLETVNAFSILGFSSNREEHSSILAYKKTNGTSRSLNIALL